ncbi:MAG TPA: UDP-glucuronic acid decarboxylase family protein [Thermoplasmata archaeon]|nr:UDP-glucuronic acid decarboxylase family protein [Thermoplasmata archaeon]
MRGRTKRRRKELIPRLPRKTVNGGDSTRDPGPVVVTGGSGFVGSHLADSLIADGHRVTVIDNLVTGRVRNLESALATGSCELIREDISGSPKIPNDATDIFHLASPASPPAYQKRPVETLWANAAGTRNVLEAARRLDCRVVLASTSEVYGDPEVHPQVESYWGHVNPTGVRSCYDEGKRFAEAISMAYRRAYGLDVRIARIFNTYGPRMDPNDGRVVSNFVAQAIERRPLTVYGTGAQTRSFCFVSDLVRGLRALMDAGTVPEGGPVNLGNPAETTVLELAQLVSEIAQVPLHIEKRPEPEDDPRRRCPDIARARTWLGWTPIVTLKDGIGATLAGFRLEVGRPIVA